MSAHVFHYINRSYYILNEELNGKSPTYIHGNIGSSALIGPKEIMQELGLFRISRFVKCNTHTRSINLHSWVFAQFQEASH
jgi:hypothetical protein